MNVISRQTLQEAAKRLSGSELPLDVWFRVAKRAQWRSLDDVRKTYSHADGVTVKEKTYTVFNIGGNEFRLITRIDYQYQTIFIKHVLTHAEYDKEDWKNERCFAAN